MDNISEPLKNYTENCDIIEKYNKSDLNGMHVKSECKEIKNNSETINNNGKNLDIHVKTHTEERPFACLLSPNFEENSVIQCPSSTIPCAKKSLFSKKDGNSTDEVRIKTEPGEINGDILPLENKEVEPPQEADGIDIVKKEIKSEEFSNNDHIKEECEESNENTKIEMTEYDNKHNVCEICFKPFATSKNLRIHMRTHTGERPYSCNECEYKSATPGNLAKHIKYVHRKERPPICEERPFLCEICPKAYKRQLDLSYHMGTIHGDANGLIRKKPYECSQCGYKCSHESNMKKHLQCVHTNERPVMCEFCPKTYKDQGGLRYHMESSHGNSMNQITCEDCKKIFKSKNGLRAHRRISHPVSGEEAKYHECDQCDYKSKYKHNIKKHIENSHNLIQNNEVFQCEHCSKTYKSVSGLEYHVGSAHANGTSIFTCEECGKPCPTKRHLRIHTKICPSLTTKPVCDECGKTFSSDACIKRHKKRRHESGMCEQCSETFPSRSALHIHMRQHNFKTSYQCDKCELSFTKISSYKAHITIHTGEKNFHCDDCGKAFRLKGLLLSHKKRRHGHTEENPYKEI